MIKFMFLMIIACHKLISEEFDHQFNSDHFSLFCTVVDKNLSKDLLSLSESFYGELQKDFSHSIDQQITIRLYPDLESHHKSIGKPDAPDWVVARADHESIDIVSPANPGPYHSKERIKKILRLNIAKVFIYNEFGTENVPYWLAFGISAKKASYFPQKPYSFPSFNDIETTDSLQFEKIGGFRIASHFVSYIENKYGWDLILQLLQDYDSFQTVFGLTKEELYIEWINSLSIPHPMS